MNGTKKSSKERKEKMFEFGRPCDRLTMPVHSYTISAAQAQPFHCSTKLIHFIIFTYHSN